MKTYQDYSEFKKADRVLREKGRAVADQYLAHVKDAVNFFHTTGNHNIQIVNDILDTASAMRLQRNRIVDWLEKLIGHEVVKLDGGKFGFGKKLEDTDYDDVVAGAPEHFQDYPDWYAWKKEADPEAYDAKTSMQKLIKRLVSDAKKAGAHHYSEVQAKLEEVAKSLEVMPIEQDEVQVEEEEAEKGPAAVAA